MILLPTPFIHLASSDIHLQGGDLLDNHSAISISLKNEDLRSPLHFGTRSKMAGSKWGKNCKAQLSWLLGQLRLSVALLILSLYHPALQQTNGQSGLGEVTPYKYTDQEDSFEIEITG